MATDNTEAVNRGATRKKAATAHPYAAIEHRVIDSPAVADLTGNAFKVLVILTRQVTIGKDRRLNNGHLHATFSYIKKFGIGSEHTLQSAVEQLISHGLIYRTKSHGANKVCARYALTWLPIQKEKAFFSMASNLAHGRIGSRRKKLPAKIAGCFLHKLKFHLPPSCNKCRKHPAKSADYELVPCRERLHLSALGILEGRSRAAGRDDQQRRCIPPGCVQSAPGSLEPYSRIQQPEPAETCSSARARSAFSRFVAVPDD